MVIRVFKRLLTRSQCNSESSDGGRLRKECNRQVVEKTDFRLSQTLEVVEFLKSHPFLNSELIECEGASRTAGPAALAPPSADFAFQASPRSSDCELLLVSSVPSEQHCARVCKFCSAADIKPPQPKTESGYIAEDMLDQGRYSTQG